MSHWITADINKFEGIFHGNRTAPSCISLSLGNEPMKEDAFKYIVEDFLLQMGYGTNKFLTTGYYPARNDSVSCIQAVRDKDDSYYVEIVKNGNGIIPFYTFCKENVSYQDTIRYFRKVLIDFDCPNLELWDDITEKVLSGIKERGEMYE